MDVIRTYRQGCFQVNRTLFGEHLAPCPDPLGSAELTREHLERFELHEQLPVIPAELWTRWVKLCFHFVESVKSNLEVTCRLLIKENDHSQWRIIIPRQAVSGASANAASFDDSIDLATGEKIQSYPPAGYIPVGSSHSHAQMGVFFSGTDDASELSDPGLHIVVGAIKLQPDRVYDIKASITAGLKRYIIPWDKVIDATPIADVDYHPDVLEYIKVGRPVAVGVRHLDADDDWESGLEDDWRQRSRRQPGYNWLPSRQTQLGFNDLEEDEEVMPFSGMSWITLRHFNEIYKLYRDGSLFGEPETNSVYLLKVRARLRENLDLLMELIASIPDPEPEAPKPKAQRRPRAKANPKSPTTKATNDSTRTKPKSTRRAPARNTTSSKPDPAATGA